MPNWRELDRWARPAADKPTVGIQGSGSLSLNRAAYEVLGSPKAIKLLYDPDERLIGFRPVEPASGTYPLNKQTNSNTYLVAGKALSQVMDIKTGVARRYDAKMIDGILTIDLKEKGVRSAPRNPRDLAAALS